MQAGPVAAGWCDLTGLPVKPGLVVAGWCYLTGLPVKPGLVAAGWCYLTGLPVLIDFLLYKMKTLKVHNTVPSIQSGDGVRAWD